MDNPHPKLSQRNKSVSISIPESSIELNSSSTSLIGSTGPLHSARKTPDVPTQEDAEAMNKYHRFKDGVMHPQKEHGEWWKKFIVLVCFGAIFFDPCFSFLLTVRKKNMCIAIDEPMTIIFVTVRSIMDLIFFMDILFKFWLAYISPESKALGAGDWVDEPIKIALHYIFRGFLLDLFNVLPLPQIVVLFVLPILGTTSEASLAYNTLLFAFIFQYIPRLIRFLPVIAGQSPTGFIYESPWINFIINLMTFVLAGHIVGSCWYLFGLQRVRRCLRAACDEDRGCLQLLDCSIGTNFTAAEHDPLRNFWKQTENVTACYNDDGFPYGIYVKAVNLTTDGNIITRYVYSFFWGFQQISTMAGNQVPSYYVWEVIFTAVITGFGLVLLALLIGNMQNFLQGVTRRRQESLLRRLDINQWMNHRGLPRELRKKVRASERYHWAATRGVKEGELMENLPEDLQREIRQPLFQFLKKVPILKSMGEPVLDEICERLRQNTYIKGCNVLKKGRVVKNMIFIRRGEMKSIGVVGKIAKLSKGDVCGEELLNWCLQQSSYDGGKRGHGLICKRMVTCSTNVEALVLSADDLEEVVSLYEEEFRAKWKDVAATTIQVAWKKSLSQASTPTAHTSHFG